METGSHSLAKSGSNYTFKWMLGTKERMKCFFYPSDPVDGFIPIGWTLSLFSKVSNISGQRGAFLRSYFVKKKCKMACCLEMSLTSNFTNIAKGTTDPRVEFISQVQTQILIKFHLQNLDQASTSTFQSNISLSIKLKLQNLDQT